MSPWVISAIGVVPIGLAVRDIFHTLWHPQGFGFLAKTVFSTTWRLSRVSWLHRWLAPLAGPLALLGTVALWTVLVVTGWAVIYLPHMPEAFNFGSALEPGASSDVVSSLYLSAVAVTTLGLGDITPADPVLRMLAPLEALVGFVLLTAAISWILQVYPALVRRRSLARRIDVLREAGTTELVRTGDPRVVSRLLSDLVEPLVTVEMDLEQYEESYYFWDRDPRHSLAAQLPGVLELAEVALASESPEVHHAGQLLVRAVDGLARALDAAFLRTDGSTAEVLAAYAADHDQSLQQDL